MPAFFSPLVMHELIGMDSSAEVGSMVQAALQLHCFNHFFSSFVSERDKDKGLCKAFLSPIWDALRILPVQDPMEAI